MDNNAEKNAAGSSAEPRLSKRAEVVLASSFFAVFVSGLYLKRLSDLGQLTVGRAVLSVIVIAISSAVFGYAFWFLYARKHRI